MGAKKKAFFLTILLLICGISTSFLFLNATLNKNALNVSNLSISTKAIDYDWLELWQESSTYIGPEDDMAINSTGHIIVGGSAQAEHHYLAVYDKNTGMRLWNDTINTSTTDIYFKALDVNGTDTYVTSSNSSNNAFNYKYNNTKSQEWNHTWEHTTASFTRPYDIALGASNMYMVGELSSGGFLAKFDASGNEEWNVSVTGAFRSLGAVVNGSSIYVVGRSSGPPDNPFLSKHSIIDGAQDWFVEFGTSNVDQANDVAVDNSGNIYVTGAIQNPSYQAFLAKFNSTGHKQWMVNYTTNTSYGGKLAIDLINNYIYVAGWVGDDYYDYESHQALQLKYDSNGNLKSNITWVQESNHQAEASSIAVDGSGNVYLVGRANNTNGVYEVFIIKNLGQPTPGSQIPPLIPGFEFVFIMLILTMVMVGYSVKKKKTTL